MIDRLWARIANMVSRWRVSSVDATQKCQQLTVDGAAVEHIEPFGFTSNPVPGAEAVVVAAGSDGDNEVAIVVGDRRYRVTGVESGGMCIYDASGHRIVLDSNGITIVVGDDGLQVQALASGASVGTNSGLVHGSGIDPFTGLTYFALGNTTAQIQAEKT